MNYWLGGGVISTTMTTTTTEDDNNNVDRGSSGLLPAEIFYFEREREKNGCARIQINCWGRTDHTAISAELQYWRRRVIVGGYGRFRACIPELPDSGNIAP